MSYINIKREPSCTRSELLRAGFITLAIMVGFFVIASGFGLNGTHNIESAYADEEAAEHKVSYLDLSPEFSYPDYSEWGCTSIYEMQELLENSQAEAEGCADDLINALGSYMDDEQIERVKYLEGRMTGAVCMTVFDKAKAEYDEIADKAQAKYDASHPTYSTSYSSGSSGGGYPAGNGVLTKSKGVNYNSAGLRETYYSSRVLYHYMTSQWTAGSDGVYRDKDGYVVVASDDLPYGSTTTSSYGPAKVYDTGVGSSNSIDIYTNW